MKSLKQTLTWTTVLAVSIVLSACGGGSDSGSSNVGGATRTAETVVFTANDAILSTGVLALFAAADDGSSLTRLSSNNVSNVTTIDQFQISPDKQWVAYIVNGDAGRANLFVVQILNGTPLQLSEPTASISSVKEFAWSPNSLQVVYSGDISDNGTDEVFLVDRDGSNHQKINGPTNDIVEVVRPQWSPDGRYIVQEVTSQGSSTTVALSIFDTRTSGSNSLRLITNTTGQIRNVSWSPDNSRVGFLADFLTINDSNIYAIDVDGENLRQVSTNSDFLGIFKWSPEGSQIAYLDDVDSNSLFELHVGAADGSSSNSIVALPGSGGVTNLEWSPNGTDIAYHANEQSNNIFELFAIQSDGSNKRRLSGDMTTSGVANKDGFEWSPNGSQIAYLADQETSTVVELFTSNADGSGNQNSTGSPNSLDISQPQWSADGVRIAFKAGDDSLQVSSVGGTPVLISDGLTAISQLAY
jgi:TolB protein